MTYRISGNAGNADFMSFELFAGPQQAGSIAAVDLEADADGEFEILFGPEKRDGNWLEVVPGTSSLLSPGVLLRLGEPRARGDSGSTVSIRRPAAGLPCPAIGSSVRSEPSATGWSPPSTSSSARTSEGSPNTANAFDPRGSRPGSGLPEIYHGFWDLRRTSA